MARSTIRVTADFLAQILEDNIPWPPGTKLRPIVPDSMTLEIEGPEVPDVPRVCPIFSSLGGLCDRTAKLDSWQPENPL